MKNKRLISVILSIALAVSLGAPVLAATPSSWAVEYVDDANTTGLLTQSAARNFIAALTRDEFCELVVEMIEQTLGKSLPVPSANPFTDTDSIYIQKAYLYGVVNGMGDNKFGPDLPVQRQQLCTMMIRAIRQMETDTGKTFLKAAADTLPFKDNAKISSYAVEPIKLAYSNSIMIGDTNNNFNPEANISSQECVAVIIRSYNNMEDVLVTGKSNAQLLDMAASRVHIGYEYGDAPSGVTQNITLPTKSTGGATVTWTSSNNGVISAAGVVNTGVYPQTVTLTATISLAGATRTKTFSLTTSTYTGESLLLQNALNELDIIYLNEGDSAESVTGRIGLPNKVLSLPVTWTTSNSVIVNTNGAVTVPSGTNTYSAALTASIKGESMTRTKTFNLTIVNPANSRGVTLHGVELGATTNQVSTLLGAPKRTIQTGSTESWSLYHTDYNNFIAVAYIDAKAAAVYSMASTAANQLKNSAGAVVSVTAAGNTSGVNALSYTDSATASQYAIMIYDSSSQIASVRTLNSEGQEQLLLELINAYRQKNGRSALLWSATLGTPSRAHSVEMGANNYLSTTSTKGFGTLQQRAEASGLPELSYTGGNVLGGGADAIEFLNKIVNTTGMRTDILSSAASMLGAGYSGGNSGVYSTYMTYMLASSSLITAVSAQQNGINVTTASVGIGSTASVTIYLTPTSTAETFTASSSNTAYFTVSGSVTNGTNGTAVTLQGVSAGTANLVITANSSGKTFTVPVTVGSTTATGVTVTPSSAVMSVGGTQQITAAPVPASATNCVYSYTSSNTAVAVVSSGGLITAVSNGNATITVTLTQGSLTFTTSMTVMVQNPSITISAPAYTVQTGGTLTLTRTTTPSTLPGDYSVVWTSSNPSVASINAATGVLTGVASGTTEITAQIYRGGAAVGSPSNKLVVTVNTTSILSIIPLESELQIKGTTVIIPDLPNLGAEITNIQWSSSNTACATVSGTTMATVVGTGPGTATISAIAILNNGQTVSGSVTITVKTPTISISGASSPASGTTTVQLTAATSNADNLTVTWSAVTTTGNVVAGIDNTGKLIIQSGTGTVTVIALFSECPSVSTTHVITIS